VRERARETRKTRGKKNGRQRGRYKGKDRRREIDGYTQNREKKRGEREREER
jgi:hypothetical protein